VQSKSNVSSDAKIGLILLPATFLANICGYVNLGNLLGRFAAIQIWIF